MYGRRRFIKRLTMYILSVVLTNSLVAAVQRTWAKAAKVLLPKGTDPQSLKLKNPAQLDNRNLKVTDLEAFSTMGLSDYHYGYQWVKYVTRITVQL